MGKVALLFPGQGAQYVGMGQDFYQNLEVCKQVFLAANSELKYDLADTCFNGPEENLKTTEITQPAILTVGVAIWRALEHFGFKPQATAGLSLGEYSALVAAGVLSFAEAVVLVQKRGRFMQEAVPQGVGTMAAIIGLNEQELKKVCDEAAIHGTVEAANYNCPGQVVIGGEIAAVEQACQIAIEMGAKKAVKLSVSAPFHTSMLKPATAKLDKELKDITFNTAKFSVYSSVTGKCINNTNDVSGLLAKQVCSPVLWEATMRQMLDDGFDTFIEVGPGKTLKGFMRRIDRKAKVFTVNSYESLQQVIENLEV